MRQTDRQTDRQRERQKDRERQTPWRKNERLKQRRRDQYSFRQSKGPVFHFFTNRSVFASVRTARTKIVGDTSPANSSHFHLSIKDLTACSMQSSHTPVCVITTGFCHYYRVPGEIKRREVELDPQVSPEENINREVDLGCESRTSFASGCSSTAVQRTLSL